MIILLTAGLFLWYVSDYYRAEDIALEVLKKDDNITVQGDITVLSAGGYTDTAIIFYPGAKVEANAYLPLLDELRDTGVACILVHMPFNLAILDYNAAEDYRRVPGSRTLVYCRTFNGWSYGVKVCLGQSGAGRWIDFDGSIYL